MKIPFAIIVILSVIGVAGAGAFVMNHGSGQGHNGCIAAFAKRIDCSEETGTPSFLNFHFDAFRSFSTATFGENMMGILAAFSATIFVFGIFWIKGFWFDSVLFRFFPNYQLLEPAAFLSQRQFIRWLALHENSPSVF